ncbi:MAG: biotin transporter BioY [Oscillospiraceae bacterium]
MKTKLLTTKNLILCALFTALIAIGAFIRIPVPLVPFTLQFIFTLLAGILLGGKLGSISVLTYIILGLMGIPIFTQGGGIGYLLKPTFGYIIGFAIGAYVTGTISNKTDNPSFKRILLGNFASMAIVYLCGMVYLYVVSNFFINSPIGVWAVVLHGCLMTIFTDILHCFFAAFLGKRLLSLMNRSKI